MEITPETQVADVATAAPAAVKVFQRHGIDFCCGGKRPLREVCDEQGIPFATLAAELQDLDAPPRASERDWREAPLGDVVDHILGAYHAPLREELPRLSAMAEKVLRVHGERHPEMVPDLVAIFRDVKAELESHMMKEEMILFPAIVDMERAQRDGRPLRDAAFAAALSSPVQVMEHEHEQVGEALAAMRRLTVDYEPPADACNTFRGLFHGLAELERELHLHIHLENNVLFPGALALAARFVE